MPEKEQSKNPEEQLRKVGSGYGAIPQDRPVSNLMAWVRIFLPMAMAALGWWVAHTVGTINERMKDIEGDIATISQSVTRDETLVTENQRRLSIVEKSMLDTVKKQNYYRDLGSVEERINDLEDEHKQQK